MFKHLLIPLDGSSLAESVLPAAGFLAQILGATVTLVHVIEKDAPKAVHGDTHLYNSSEAEKYLRNISRRAVFRGVKIKYHVHTSAVADVAESIVQHVGEFAPDLIVMCTHGRSGARDWFVGNIAQQVIASGETPVLVIPAKTANKVENFECKQILVALDGNPEHEGSLQLTGELARICHSSIYLLMVVPEARDIKGKWTVTSRLLPQATSKMLDMSVENAREYLNGHRNALEEKGSRVEAIVVRGDPAEMIGQTAKKLETDMIIMGTHGTAGMNAFWEGSVTPQICKKCDIPLLLVPVSKTGG